MIDDYLIAFVSGFKHRKHRAGRFTSDKIRRGSQLKPLNHAAGSR